MDGHPGEGPTILPPPSVCEGTWVIDKPSYDVFVFCFFVPRHSRTPENGSRLVLTTELRREVHSGWPSFRILGKAGFCTSTGRQPSSAQAQRFLMCDCVSEEREEGEEGWVQSLSLISLRLALEPAGESPTPAESDL